MGTRRAGMVAMLVLAAGVLGTGGASAAPTPAPATDDVAAVTARVAALTAQYRQHGRAAAAAAARLADAYTVSAAADDDQRAAQDRAELGRATLAARARALYARGAAARDGLSLLAADDPQDAIWMLSVRRPLARRLLADAVAGAQAARRDAASADRRAAAADAAVALLGTSLTAVRQEEEAADWALRQARGELATLRAASAARAAEAARRAEADLERARRDTDATRLPTSTQVRAVGMPAEFERAYRDAAPTCPGLDWALLAAVGQVESGHGRNNGPSSAGAIGPMQFMPATFAAYAVDGDGDGRTDPWNTRDAVFTAARYLCAAGAGRGAAGERAALFTYNHAQWYVDLVLSARAAITARPTGR